LFCFVFFYINFVLYTFVFYDEHTLTVDRGLCISIQSLKRRKTQICPRSR